MCLPNVSNSPDVRPFSRKDSSENHHHATNAVAGEHIEGVVDAAGLVEHIDDQVADKGGDKSNQHAVPQADKTSGGRGPKPTTAPMHTPRRTSFGRGTGQKRSR